MWFTKKFFHHGNDLAFATRKNAFLRTSLSLSLSLSLFTCPKISQSFIFVNMFWTLVLGPEPIFLHQFFSFVRLCRAENVNLSQPVSFSLALLFVPSRKPIFAQFQRQIFFRIGEIRETKVTEANFIQFEFRKTFFTRHYPLGEVWLWLCLLRLFLCIIL